MKKFLSNYKDTIILILAIILGTIVGITFGEKAAILKPFGDLFLNLLFIVIVPLIFITITSSISKMKSPKRLGKIMISIFAVFIITSLISVIFGLITTSSCKLVNVKDGEKIKEELSLNDDSESDESKSEDLSILERTVSVLTVNDFNKLLSKENIIALLVMSILVGLAINMTGDAAKPVVDLINGLNATLINLIKLIMYYAPIGLGCYFASLIGTFGGEIAIGYAKTFIIYTVVAIAFYFVIYSIYALIAGGVEGFKRFWKNILPTTVTSIATCSSAASIPVNVKSVKAMGVSNDIAETIVPLGTSFHKDGSIIGSVFKIMFLVSLFGADMSSAGILKIVGISLLANLLVMAVPIGGGTISEMLIITMMGYPVYALPILTMIATIIDPPATLLNVVGDSASSMLVARIVDGKDWIKKSQVE